MYKRANKTLSIALALSLLSSNNAVVAQQMFASEQSPFSALLAPSDYPIEYFFPPETQEGVTLEPNTHNYVLCTQDGTPSILQEGVADDPTKSYWVREEPPEFARSTVQVSGDAPETLFERLSNGMFRFLYRNEDSTCGNGIREGDEQCDDGNDDNQDSCKNNCTTRSGQTTEVQTFFYSKGTIDLYPNLQEQSTLTSVRAGILYYIKTEQDLFFKCDEDVSCGDDVCTDAENTQICPPDQPCRKLCEQDCGVPDNPTYCLPCADTCVEWTVGSPPLDCGQNVAQCAKVDNVCTRTDVEEIECGNEEVEEGETCDDGNRLSNDGCSSACVIEECGDGIKQANETCDDGNEVDDDNCKNDCTRVVVPECGDETVDDNEECDDGNEVDDDECTNACLFPACGDGILHDANDAEQCDDGNTNNNDGCTSECVREVCGDGVQQTSEQCDDGNNDDGDGCTASCIAEVCGDGIVQGIEQCDDENAVNNDGCQNNCRFPPPAPKCGDGNVNTNKGEECDDGNNVNFDGCSLNCQNEVCGDGIVQANIGEQCDDGNSENFDECMNNCTQPAPKECSDCGSCGRGIGICTESKCANLGPCQFDDNFFGGSCKPHPDFCENPGGVCADCGTCGDGFWNLRCDEVECNNLGPCSFLNGQCDPEPQQCTVEVCGDGVQQDGEECDDANRNNNDGCSGLCIREVCGDGTKQSNEACDDGNTENNDGCSSSCNIEVCVAMEQNKVMKRVTMEIQKIMMVVHLVVTSKFVAMEQSKAMNSVMTETQIIMMAAPRPVDTKPVVMA